MKAKTSVGTLVINHHQELKSFSSHTELKEWADKHQLNTGILFAQFKRRLLDIGVDYEQLKVKKYQKVLNSKESYTHELTLYCSASATQEKFGITNYLGEVVWYGRFFDQNTTKSQSDSDLMAATKALWFASKVFTADSLIKGLKLNLYVDALWLTFQMHDKQKAFELTKLALKYNLALNIVFVEKEKNPASRWTTELGFKKWSDNNLNGMAEPVLQFVTA